jgi:D-sedoheptulose 7-phosphate isomerase
VLLAPPHLPGWNDVPLPERLRERLGLPVHWMHDARAGAWAEWQFGVGRESGVCRMAFLTFATGFGMGVVLDGRLLDIPGEVGHWRVAEDGPGMFGKRGSLEGLASGAGIAAQGGRPVEELAEAARAGDAKALALFDAVAVQVGRQCARLIDLFGLDAVALGTIAVKCEDLLIDRICEVARQEALPHLAKNCRIAPSALGEELGDLACLSAALSRGLGGESALGPRACGQVAESARLLDVLLADKVFLDAVDSGAARIVEALAAGHKVLTCGNGGSATDAAHLAEELIGRYRGDGPSLAAVNLCADGSVLTCIANDYGFDAIFSRQVEGMGRKGDVLVAFTTSGNTENVNRALHVARERGVFTIALTGKNGGAARQIADLAIHVPHAASERIQEIHTFVLHAFCEAAEARFRSPGKKP